MTDVNITEHPRASPPHSDRPRMFWASVWEYHRIGMAVMVGVFLGAQGEAVGHRILHLKAAAAQLGTIAAKEPWCVQARPPVQSLNSKGAAPDASASDR